MSQSSQSSEIVQSVRHSKKKFGVCSVCKRQISETSTGVKHSHGLGGQCTGSGCAPTTAIAVLSLVVPSTSASLSTVGQVNLLPVCELSSECLLNTVVSARCRVLKFIPKASCTLAASKFTDVLRRILSDPDDVNLWQQFLLFAYRCF